MASAVDLTVSVEAIIHKSLRELAQKILDEHGIRIDAVDFEWIETVTLDTRVDRSRSKVTSVSVDSVSYCEG